MSKTASAGTNWLAWLLGLGILGLFVACITTGGSECLLVRLLVGLIKLLGALH